MGLWDKIKKTLLKGLWPEKKKTRKRSPKKAVKSKRPAARLKKSTPKKKAFPAKKKSLQAPKPELRKPAETRPVKKQKSVPVKKITKPAGKDKGQRKAPSGEYVGTVTHYFAQVNVAALKIEKRGLMTGETIRFEGHTTKFKTVIRSMQINRKPVLSASVGDEIGIQVHRRVRAGDQVFFQD